MPSRGASAFGAQLEQSVLSSLSQDSIVPIVGSSSWARTEGSGVTVN